MLGKQVRLERIVDRESGRTVIIPMDHGTTVGPIPGLLLWASEGEFTVVDCHWLEADIPYNGAYFWGSGKVPFVDEFDIPFPDPVTGVFQRMLAP